MLGILQFQSLKGFSVGCDPEPTLRPRRKRPEFQSLKGFSVGCDLVLLCTDPRYERFQSLKGFSVGCDGR